MIALFFGGGLLILIGVTFALQKEVYYSTSCLFVTINEGKLSEHDAMWLGIALALTGTLLVGIGFYRYFKNKSNPS